MAAGLAALIMLACAAARAHAGTTQPESMQWMLDKLKTQMTSALLLTPSSASPSDHGPIRRPQRSAEGQVGASTTLTERHGGLQCTKGP
jgi:hypothetical protein